MENLKNLLTNYYISKEYNKELYYSVKDGLKEIMPFLKEKLGYNTIVKGDFIKLEKIPGTAESFMGIEEFTENKEYVFLMLILMFLEDKGKEEQFLLSHITDFITSNQIGDMVDWTHYYTRKSLVKVLKFCVKHKIIIVDDGDEESFAKDSAKEILFESTGISKYMIRSFNKPIEENTTYDDIVNEVINDVEEDKGSFRRNRVYRNLLMSPIVYREEDKPDDYDYIKNYRNIIALDFERYLGLKLHVHKNGAMLVPEDNNRFDIETFPRNNGISDFVLLVCKHLNEHIRSNKENLLKDDTYVIDKEKFEDILQEVKKQKGQGLSKEYREGAFSKIVYDTIEYMERLKIISEKEEKIIIYPLCGKVIGDYPKDYISKLEGKEDEDEK